MTHTINFTRATYKIWQQKLKERCQNKLSNLLPPRSHDKWVAYERNRCQKHRQCHFRRRMVLTQRTSDSPSTVVNLSGVTLTDGEFHLLLRGLSFCPTPHHFNKDQLLDDLHCRSVPSTEYVDATKRQGCCPGHLSVFHPDILARGAK